MLTSVRKLYNVFEQAKQLKLITLTGGIKKEIEEFNKYKPIIRALCAEGLKERHIA